MTSPNHAFPDWFDWEEYEQLANLKDRAKWAYLFAVRDSNPDITLEEVGISQRVDGDFLERIPRLTWKDGVLFQGMNGHSTHSVLVKREEWSAGDAEFISIDEFQNRQKNGSLQPGTVITTATRNGVHGHYVFTKDTSSSYLKTRQALGAGTIELAINICMPKEIILKEVERIIDDKQSRFGGVFKQKKLKRQTLKQWSRGLACWDLINQANYSQYQLAKQLAPLWREGDVPAGNGEPAQDEDKKQVATALKAIKPMIAGGWKVLCGDPVATMGSDLIELDHNRK